MKDDNKEYFSQEGIHPKEQKTLEDFFQIKGDTLHFKGTLQTANFIYGKRGVQIKNEGLSSSGGLITDTDISGGTTTSTLVANATGVLYGNGASAVTAIAGVTGTFYVATVSGGSPTHLVTVTNGIIVSIA